MQGGRGGERVKWDSAGEAARRVGGREGAGGGVGAEVLGGRLEHIQGRRGGGSGGRRSPRGRRGGPVGPPRPARGGFEQ